MNFEALIDFSATEEELLELVIEEIRAHYDHYRQSYFFLRLAKAEQEGESKIIWVRKFASIQELEEFYFDTEMERACFSIRPREEHYEVLVHSFYISDWFDVYPDRIANSRPDKRDGTVENEKIASKEERELFEKAFGELTDMMAESKPKKTG